MKQNALSFCEELYITSMICVTKSKCRKTPPSVENLYQQERNKSLVIIYGLV